MMCGIFPSSYLCFYQPGQESAVDGTHHHTDYEQNNSHEHDLSKQTTQLLADIDTPDDKRHAAQPGKHICGYQDGCTPHFSAYAEPLSKGQHCPIHCTQPGG